MEQTDVDAGDLAEGDLVVIDGDPCVVTDVDTTQPGKHGTAKVNVAAEGLFDGAEHSLSQPDDAAVPVPDLDRQRNPLIVVGGDAGEAHFDPRLVRVAGGTEVVWLWDDGARHGVVADGGGFGSDVVADEGLTFEHTFEEAGVHRYRCPPHDGVGVVVVD